MEARPYQEPPLNILLPLASLFPALHLVAYVFELVKSCGLVGQILVGIIWGEPLTSWLGLDYQNGISSLGYIGLISLVYEGGLRTELKLLRQNFVPSVLVAATGVIFPFVLSFLLIPISTIDKRTAIASGAALSSTSLGTICAILLRAKLINTNAGTVLATAAMLDDVVGFIMVSIISSIGEGSDAKSIIRTICCSLGAPFVFLLICFSTKLFPPKARSTNWVEEPIFSNTVLAIATLGSISAAGYAGASKLFVVYLAGVSTSYLFKDSISTNYEKCWGRFAQGIFIPFFFASIGFAIPIRQMFEWSIIWRGIIYAVLMTFGKCLTGIWLILLPFWLKIERSRTMGSDEKGEGGEVIEDSCAPKLLPPNISLEQNTTTVTAPTWRNHCYPALLVSFAMTTRGEIGFLIAGIGQSTGMLAPKAYMVVMWAVMLCTVLGPLGVGFIIWLIKKSGGRYDALGLWG